jgi:HemY protein
MIRLLTIILAAALIAAGIVWIVERPGEMLFTVDGYQLRTGAGVAIALAILFVGLVGFLTRLVALVLGSPGAVGRWFAARRSRRGTEALSRGLVAAAAGDAMEARRHALKAQTLLGSPPLALLLTAQSAQLDGDESLQAEAYRAMLAHPDTEFLGLRGLFMQAMRREDHGEAVTLAARAHALKPKAAWAANALFDLKSARGEWADAKAVLESAGKARLADSGLVRRRRAVLLAAEALEAERRGDGERALSAALEAIKLSPALTPAAVLAGRRLAMQGRSWRAQDVIEGAWTQAPHPDLAGAYAAIKPDETPDERAERMKGLAHLNRDHFESRILEAEQAVNLAEWAEARRLLSPLARGSASARVCALMAEIEQRERKDAAAAHTWLNRAVRAPRDADWRCGNCGWLAPEWHAVCGGCGAFDSLSWSAPVSDSLEMLPGAARDERLGADVAAPSFHKPAEFEDPRGDALPSRARKHWREDSDERAGFVVLPRPPDDPGPDGYEYDNDVAAGGGVP